MSVATAVDDVGEISQLATLDPRIGLTWRYMRWLSAQVNETVERWHRAYGWREM